MPKLDGDNTHRCSDKGGGVIYRGQKQDMAPKVVETTPPCGSDTGVALAGGRRGVISSCLSHAIECVCVLCVGGRFAQGGP